MILGPVSCTSASVVVIETSKNAIWHRYDDMHTYYIHYEYIKYIKKNTYIHTYTYNCQIIYSPVKTSSLRSLWFQHSCCRMRWTTSAILRTIDNRQRRYYQLENKFLDRPHNRRLNLEAINRCCDRTLEQTVCICVPNTYMSWCTTDFVSVFVPILVSVA